MVNLSQMKIEKLKVSRETVLTLKRMKISTVKDLASVSNNFLMSTNKLLCNMHESNQAVIMFNITTLLECIQNGTIGHVYDENLKVSMAKGIDIDYPNNICNSLSSFDDFMKSRFCGHISSAMEYVQDIAEGRNQNRVLTAIECILLKLRFKYLYTYEDIGKLIGNSGTMAEYIISKALRKLNSWIRNLATDNIEKLQLSVRAYNCLKRAGINTCSQLKLLKEDDLMKMRNMGKHTCSEILSAVKSLG